MPHKRHGKRPRARRHKAERLRVLLRRLHSEVDEARPRPEEEERADRQWLENKRFMREQLKMEDGGTQVSVCSSQ